MFYIGSTRDFSNRWSAHVSSSKLNLSTILYKYITSRGGIDEFSYDILEHCNKEDLKRREQFFYELMKPPLNDRRPCTSQKCIHSCVWSWCLQCKDEKLCRLCIHDKQPLACKICSPIVCIECNKTLSSTSYRQHKHKKNSFEHIM
jgi:hypothetical protein